MMTVITGVVKLFFPDELRSLRQLVFHVGTAVMDGCGPDHHPRALHVGQTAWSCDSHLPFVRSLSSCATSRSYSRRDPTAPRHNSQLVTMVVSSVAGRVGVVDGEKGGTFERGEKVEKMVEKLSPQEHQKI